MQMKCLFQPVNRSNQRSSVQTQRCAPSPTPVQVIKALPPPLPILRRDEVGKRPSQQFACHLYFSASADFRFGGKKDREEKEKARGGGFEASLWDVSAQ